MGARKAFRARAVPERAHPLVRCLFEALAVEKVTDADAERRAGLSPSVVRRWRTQHVPRVDHLQAALNGVGLELFIRPRRIDSPQGSVPCLNNNSA